MLRRLAFIGLAAFTVSACNKGSTGNPSGPVVARGDGFTITAGDFKARLDEQSPFLRSRLATIEKRREFLDKLVQREVLLKEAKRQKLQNDADVQKALEDIMVRKLVQRRFSEPGASASVPDADIQKYFDEHSAEFHRAKKVRASVIVLQAPANAPERAKKLAAAKQALAILQAPPPPPDARKGEAAKPGTAARKEAAPPKPGAVAGKEPIKPGDPLAFGKLVAQLSDDATTKAAAVPGDTGVKTIEELEKAYSKELASAVFGMKQGELSGIIESPQALYIAKVTLVQEEVNRTLEQVKPQIVARLSRELKAKEFEEFVKKLEDAAKVKVDDAALAAVEVAPASPADASMPMGHPMPPGGHTMPMLPGGHQMPMQPGASPAMTPAGKPGGDVQPAGSTPAPAPKE